MKRSAVFLLAALCCAPIVRAQDASPATETVAPKDVAPTTVAPDPLAEDLAKYTAMFRRGFYDELIYTIDQKIASLPEAQRDKPDSRLLWRRGTSYYRLGWYEKAEADFLAAQKESRKGYSTVEWLDAIKNRKVLLPPNIKEIREGERVIFRVHYSSMENGTASIFGLLPDAYRVSQKMFGSDVEATTIYVFDTFEQMSAYYKQMSGSNQLGSWMWALTSGPEILLCLERADGTSSSRDHRQDFVTTIVHEYNHAMLNRLMGTTTQPKWFKEGLAQIAGGVTDPKWDPVNQKMLATLFRNEALVPIKKLEGNGFAEQTELGIKMRAGDDRNKAPDPYVQSYVMTRYLMGNISTPQLQSFLNRVRESEDFNGSFADEFGMTTEQFYELWKRETARQLAAG